MPREERSSVPPAAAPPFSPPYRQSWFDVLKRWVEQRPGPYWSPYVGLGAAFFLIESLMHLPGDGWLAAMANPVRALLSAMAVGFLLLMHALDRLAAHSFDAFRPVLRASDLEAQRLRYQLTCMPPRSPLLAALCGVLAGLSVLMTPFLAQVASGIEGRAALTKVMRLVGGFEISTSPASLAFNGFVLALTWCVTGTLIYHTIRQLRWISRIYTEFTLVDLLRPGPLYRLSRVTASTALGLIAVIYLWFAADPVFFTNPVNLASAAVMGSLALGAFLLPLLGIHRILVLEKEQMLHHAADRLKAAIGELHRRVDQGHYAEMDDLNKAIDSLETERNIPQPSPYLALAAGGPADCPGRAPTAAVALGGSGTARSRAGPLNLPQPAGCLRGSIRCAQGSVWLASFPPR